MTPSLYGNVLFSKGREFQMDTIFQIKIIRLRICMPKKTLGGKTVTIVVNPWRAASHWSPGLRLVSLCSLQRTSTFCSCESLSHFQKFKHAITTIKVAEYIQFFYSITIKNKDRTNGWSCCWNHEPIRIADSYIDDLSRVTILIHYSISCLFYRKVQKRRGINGAKSLELFFKI